ncbi:hypothetical protein B0X27_08140 [Listeria monocytogenes]|uniref:Holliday junction branch migration protein RuvA n=1 Tax=Listeria monocytogenes TaxID=1639 RepID=UPI0009807584|nr:hypothetical protein B0X22_07945 [Listeria monocytogenes]AQP71145.1 hypothetical protein B0X27_08140 [Listeria monocytogenes]AQP73993.1 hypothetical protein B0X18_07965 [Listeria monocytogenes]AQP79750.1 hypothetical protein B0X21_08015 [Listeria monocytogenes]AQP85638.1 hypothetical protein B0X17_08040 [Listeria monocytogenes]
MYDYIKGTVTTITPEYIVVEAGQIGYQIITGNPFSFQRLEGTEAQVFLYQHVREDNISLFGFQTTEERYLFKKLLSVSGIGPKSALAKEALTLLQVDPRGLDTIDQKLLHTIIQSFRGGPVGLDTIAASIGEERETIEDMQEPYLLQIGFLQRTPRGRIATETAYNHLGISYEKEV